MKTIKLTNEEHRVLRAILEATERDRGYLSVVEQTGMDDNENVEKVNATFFELCIKTGARRNI